MPRFEELFKGIVESNPDIDAQGIVGKLLDMPEGFSAAINELADRYSGRSITRLVSAQANKSMVGAPVGARLGALFLNADEFPEENEMGMIRCFTLVHGSNALEKQPAFISDADKVLIIVDVIDGSDTLIDVVSRIRSVGADIVGVGALAKFCADDYCDKLVELGVGEVFALATA